MIIYSLIIRIIKDKYIKTNDTHNIYTIKLTIIQMIILLFKEKIDEYINIHIFIDNQFTIQTIESSK